MSSVDESVLKSLNWLLLLLLAVFLFCHIPDLLSKEQCVIKTKEVKSKFEKLGIKSATFIEVGDINKNFLLSTRNLKNIDLLSVNGLNAYQIIKREDLVVSLSAVKEVVKRYGNE